MVYVVERYLPRPSSMQAPPWPVPAHRRSYETSHRRRYLGSTIVLSDEACVCHFGSLPEAVAEANRRAGADLRPDRPRRHGRPHHRSPR